MAMITPHRVIHAASTEHPNSNALAQAELPGSISFLLSRKVHDTWGLEVKEMVRRARIAVDDAEKIDTPVGHRYVYASIQDQATFVPMFVMDISSVSLRLFMIQNLQMLIDDITELRRTELSYVTNLRIHSPYSLGRISGVSENNHTVN